MTALSLPHSKDCLCHACIQPNKKDRKKSMRKESKDVFDLFKGVEFDFGAKQWSWQLTGHMYQPYENCGQVHTIGCEKTHKHLNHLGKGTYKVDNCKRLGCPTCFEGAAAQRSMVVLSRFSAKQFGTEQTEDLIQEIAHNHEIEHKKQVKKVIVGYLEQSIKRQRLKIKHVIVSPLQQVAKEQWIDHKGYIKSRKTAYKIAQQCGVKGGVLIPHPYRLKCANCGYSPIPDHKRSCPTCNQDRFLWYFSPHFHIIGHGWVTNTTKNYQKSGWIVKNAGVRKSIYATTQYLLSHAGINRGTLTLNWFGDLSRQKMGRSPKLPKIHQKCDECQTAYHVLQWMPTDRPPPIMSRETQQFTFKYGEYSKKAKI